MKTLQVLVQSIAHTSDKVGTRGLDTGLGFNPNTASRGGGGGKATKKVGLATCADEMSTWSMSHEKMPHFITRKM